MKRSATHVSALVTLLGILTMACSDDVSGPNEGSAASEIEVAGSPVVHSTYPLEAGVCGKLDVPAAKLVLRTWAEGAQIYRWNGNTWTFVAPDARLSADPNRSSTVGSHYGGPTWETNSGSTVVAAVRDRCTPDASAIPWLLLEATSTAGSGMFRDVTFIQRVNTAGGLAPASPGSFVGEVARVPYTTEYLFLRTH